MSTIVHVVEKNDSKLTRVLVKGAPELIKPFLTGSEVPGALQSYDNRFQHLTQIGMTN